MARLLDLALADLDSAVSSLPPSVPHATTTSRTTIHLLPLLFDCLPAKLQWSTLKIVLTTCLGALSETEPSAIEGGILGARLVLKCFQCLEVEKASRDEREVTGWILSYTSAIIEAGSFTRLADVQTEESAAREQPVASNSAVPMVALSELDVPVKQEIPYRNYTRFVSPDSSIFLDESDDEGQQSQAQVHSQLIGKPKAYVGKSRTRIVTKSAPQDRSHLRRHASLSELAAAAANKKVIQSLPSPAKTISTSSLNQQARKQQTKQAKTPSPRKRRKSHAKSMVKSEPRPKTKRISTMSSEVDHKEIGLLPPTYVSYITEALLSLPNEKGTLMEIEDVIRTNHYYWGNRNSMRQAVRANVAFECDEDGNWSIGKGWEDHCLMGLGSLKGGQHDRLWCTCKRPTSWPFGNMIQCKSADKCKSEEWYHHTCVGLPQDFPIDEIWTCQACL